MIPNPWILLGIGLAWLASLVGVGYWQRSDGREVERSAWVQREAAQLVLVNQKILALEEDARAKEAAHAAAVTQISTHYQEELKNVSDRAKADRVAVRAGGLRLFDPAAPGLRACGSIAAQAGAAAGGRDGPEAGELSGASVEFLFEIANDADAITLQLGAAQEVILADRAACGAH